MTIAAPTRDHMTPIEDSRRWQHIALRPDDIVITTPPKCGTTWTQRIVMSLLWPADDAPASIGDLNVWVDSRVHPIEDVSAALEAQMHRRFIKTHSPADATPRHSDVRYLAVYRDPADALVSWGNHRKHMRSGLVDYFNKAAESEGIPTIPGQFQGDYDELLVEWLRWWSVPAHLSSWWTHRHDENVMLLHYQDVYDDLDGSMRGIAEFLDLEVPDELWNETVARCRIDAMRDEARADGLIELAFEGGAESFFHKGGSGRGQQQLSQVQRDRIQAHADELLPSEAAAWLAGGGPVR
jgi:aryl sulfotransferase